MISLLLAATLYSASLAAGDRPIPVSAYEVWQAHVADASAKDALWLGTTAAADLYSGALALDRCPSCFEANPILPSYEARIAFKAGYTFSAWYGLRKLRQGDHPKLASVLRWCVVAINLGLTANNTARAVRGH